MDPRSPGSLLPTPRGRRRADALVRGLILVAVVAILGGLYVGWRRPLPRYPQVAPAASPSPEAR